MRNVRSAPGATLAIVLVCFGCGATSKLPEDAAVERGGTDGTIADSGRGADVAALAGAEAGGVAGADVGGVAGADVGGVAGADVGGVVGADVVADVPAGGVDGSVGDGAVVESGEDAGAGAVDLPASTEVGPDGAVDLFAPDLSAMPDSASEKPGGGGDAPADTGPKPECDENTPCPSTCTINPKCGSGCLDGRCVPLPCCFSPTH